MDGPRITGVVGHAGQPKAKAVLRRVLHLRIRIAEDIHAAPQIGIRVRAGEKVQQGGGRADHVLVSIHHQGPCSGAPVQHRIPGGGKVINPGEIKENIRIPLRHLPGAVGGAGVGDHQLAGGGVPQGLESLKTPLNAADLIFDNHTDGQQRLFHGGHFLSCWWGGIPFPYPAIFAG